MPVIHDLSTQMIKVWRRPHIVSITIDDLTPELLSMITGGGLVSNPPVGCYKVTNIYVDENGKLVVKWSDNPQGV
jgi:hypothetical protein